MTRFTRSRSLGGRQTPKTSKEEDGDQQASGQSPCQKKNQSKRQSSQTVAPNGGHKQETESTESQTAASESKNYQLCGRAQKLASDRLTAVIMSTAVDINAGLPWTYPDALKRTDERGAGTSVVTHDGRLFEPCGFVVRIRNLLDFPGALKRTEDREALGPGKLQRSVGEKEWRLLMDGSSGLLALCFCIE
ncbi:hypothetical protein ACOMHN_011281 [Nucella lapillus]